MRKDTVPACTARRAERKAPAFRNASRASWNAPAAVDFSEARPDGKVPKEDPAA
ncbi:MAG: hypothetical protein ACT4PE_17720 [Candidatus Eiseniibacteriota bacterium]